MWQVHWYAYQHIPAEKGIEENDIMRNFIICTVYQVLLG
jgi:hypothetical protein